MHRKTWPAARGNLPFQGAGRSRRPGFSSIRSGACASIGLLLAGLTACDGGSPGWPGDPPDDPGPNAPLPTRVEVPGPHACNLRVSELSLFQAVKVPLMRNGEAVEARTAPVIEGRRTFFRAYLGYDDRPAPGNAVARLRLESSGGVQEFEAGGLVTDPSSDAVLESSLNFDVPAEAIRPDTKVSLKLHIGDDCPNQGIRTYPPAGGYPLATTDTGVLKVVLVPIQYNADGSGRLPNLAEDQVQRYRDLLMAIYPTRQVEITVREAVSSAVALTNSTGWPNMLEALREQRARDGAPNDAYYYGLVEPAVNFTTYCRSTCVAGLSYLVDNLSATRLVGLGVGFITGSIAGETLIHEIGHQHGRGHSPCGGGAGEDKNYPHPLGGIGEWGLDMRFAPPRLQNPATRKDLMGYCNPQWISDYTYAAIATRRTAISAPATSARAIRSTEPAIDLHRTLLADGDGGVTWGRPLTGETAPSGRPERAHVLDANGLVVGEVTVYRTSYGHGAGSSIDVPAPRPGWASLAVDGLPPIDFHAVSAVPSLGPAVAR
jgi:hypothetical protein